jgi:hypothetical protein
MPNSNPLQDTAEQWKTTCLKAEDELAKLQDLMRKREEEFESQLLGYETLKTQHQELQTEVKGLKQSIAYKSRVILTLEHDVRYANNIIRFIRDG